MTEYEHPVENKEAYRAELDAQFDSVMRHIPDIKVYKKLPFEEYLNTHPDAQYYFTPENIILFPVFIDEAKKHFEKESKKPVFTYKNEETGGENIKVTILKHKDNPEFLIEYQLPAR